MPSPALSVVVVFHDMAREAPRTLYALSAEYQRHIAADAFEIIAVDNGSSEPLDAKLLARFAGTFRLLRIDDAPASPAYAINCGLRAARGEVIGVMIDGARIATPGLLHFALQGARTYENAVVATLGWYLGWDFQGHAIAAGYDRKREDALLESIAWPSDGYRLFEIGTMDESSTDGWFQPIAESNAIFARRAMWDLVGGAEERFDSPGGGLLNLDLFERLLAVEGARLVMPIGEATFHQIHGGISTNAAPHEQLAKFEGWAAQFQQIRGRSWEFPDRFEATYIGTLSKPALQRFVRSAVYPPMSASPVPIGAGFRHDVWSDAPDLPIGDERAQRLVALGREKFREGQFEAARGVGRLLGEMLPDERGLDRIRSLVTWAFPDPDGPPADRVPYFVAVGEAYEIIGDADRARDAFGEALAIEPNVASAHLGLARLRLPGESYLWWLDTIYAKLAPASVIEIGVFEGNSLALLRPPTIAIGIDPAARILSPLQTSTHVFAETSDAFFARNAADAVLGTQPLSIGFIDGMHTFEQALKDFVGLEALCHEQSIIMLHDTVPLSDATQTRDRTTQFWTGDVWKIVPCLKHFRPDLDIRTIATFPSGLTIVQNLDPASRVLVEKFDEAVALFAQYSFGALEPRLATELNLVANDWDAFEPHLRSGSSDRPRVKAPPAFIGTYAIDREQPELESREREIVDGFHDLYYTRWSQRDFETVATSWFGHQTLKCPLDLWMYQEIVLRTRPEVIVETGTWRGGSALYLAMLLDQLGRGRVITIDLHPQNGRPEHPRIEYVTGSSTDGNVANAVSQMVGGARAMVLLDSDHSVTHVYDELRAYSGLVHPGYYLIVEDTNVNGHPTFPEHGPGPMEAVERFLSETDAFVVDRNSERFLMTLNPGGYLRRR